jgi:light-regulated signal transduction histidine kinase (bacteriophytochrome)
MTEDAEESKAECDAGDVRQEVIKNLQPEIAASQAEVTYGELPRVAVSSTHSLQILQNLVSNALKYRGSQPARVQVSADGQGRELIFVVRDNGIDIPAQHHGSIFHFFKRLHGRETPGTGIGLTLCERIVTHYGGRIWGNRSQDRDPASVSGCRLPRRMKL